MNEYLLLFYNKAGDGQYISTVADMAEDMPRWQQWIGHIAQQGKLVSTQPIEYNGAVVSNGGVAEGPYLREGELVVGYVLCRAESQDEVTGWGRTCPVLKYPLGRVEIRAAMPFAI